MRYLILLLLLTQCATAQNIKVDGLGDSNFGLELCDVNDCVEYKGNATLNINQTQDYILKIKPISADTSGELTSYFLNNNFYVNIILLMVFIAFILLLAMVVGNVQ